MSFSSSRTPAFPTTPFGAVGYCRAEVDRFLGRLQAGAAQQPPAITAAEVTASRFHVARLGRCYAMPAVDDYLDEAAATLRAAGAEGEADPRPGGRHHATWWVYGIAAALIAVIAIFVLTQL